MLNVELPDQSRWGHISPEITPMELISRLREETEQGIPKCLMIPEGPESCNDEQGYFRVSVVIHLPETLFDQLMNGATGYRAHYSVSMECGKGFNRRLVEAVAPIVVQAEHLYKDKFDRVLCEMSLLGPFSKFWFTKQLTDPSAQNQLLNFGEELRVPRWLEFWRNRPEPRKGLLAPVPDEPSVLLNGTFVNCVGSACEQKKCRSKQLFESGWT